MPKCGSAMRRTVSILARPEGRALLCMPSEFVIDQCFNPRPPRRTGATYGMTVRYGISTCFNPRPSPRDGRYIRLTDRRPRKCTRFNPRPPRGTGATRWSSCEVIAHRLCFNPRPPRRTGATCASPGNAQHVQFQSSPAPKDGRYVDARIRAAPSSCFNPRPPRRTGATSLDIAHDVVYSHVSILARPEGRALPLRSSRSEFVSILARPEGRALLVILARKAGKTIVSILAHPGGRALPATINDARHVTLGCFNPRPPRGTGATKWLHADLQSVPPVSILARPRGSGATGTRRFCDPKHCFNPRPPPRDGRYLVFSRVPHVPAMFQSSPTPREGATQFLRHCNTCSRFQSSPAPRDGRYLRQFSSDTHPA